jgi:hypothetical protein
MNKPESSRESVERDRSPATELSTEERQVLNRIEKQPKPKRRKPWWRRVPDSTLFFWWLCW